MKTITRCIALIMAVMILSCNRGTDKSFKKTESPVQDVTLMDDQKSEERNKPMTNGLVSTLDSTTTTTASQSSANVLQAGNPAPAIDWDKKIIKTANLTLELKDYKSYNADIHKSLKGYGAYIAGEEQNESEEKITNSVIIKVPVDKFEDLVNSFPTESVKVIEKKITTDDVTGEVVDTKSRIEAKKQVRARYLDLLKQAKNMEEILQVQSEINSIQEDLESAGGRVDYLVHQSAYSTIHLTYYQYLNGITQKDTQPTFFSKLAEAFKNGSSIISGLLLIIVTIWPILLAAIIGWFLIKKWKLATVKTSK